MKFSVKIPTYISVGDVRGKRDEMIFERSFIHSWGLQTSYKETED